MNLYYCKSLCGDESGAVTVDWVVLTATLVVIAGATALAVNEQTQGLAGEIETYLTDTELG